MVPAFPNRHRKIPPRCHALRQHGCGGRDEVGELAVVAVTDIITLRRYPNSIDISLVALKVTLSGSDTTPYYP